MKSQLPGMSRSQSRALSGSSDLQLWQQQLLYKQLQELEQRQQVQHVNQMTAQQNSLGHLPVATKQSSADMLPAHVIGMPINNASNGVWQNEFVRVEPKIPSNSPLFSGNVNSTRSSMHGLQNGLMFPNGPSQLVHSLGFAPQHDDQSLFGMPVSLSRDSSNQYSHVQVRTNASISKAGRNQNVSLSEYGAFSEQGNAHDGLVLANHVFHGNDLLRNDHNQIQGSRSLPTNNQSHPSHIQKAQAQQSPSNWSETPMDKAVMLENAYCGGSNLDPTEKKLLFGTNDEGLGHASFSHSIGGSVGSSVGNSLGSDKNFGGFPSLQSGSFSALMLDALDGTSSDNGVQEEWSGLSLQKTEVSTPNENTSKQSAWVGKDLQNLSSMPSRSNPFYFKTVAQNSQTALAFHHSSGKSLYEHNERLSTGPSIGQQSLKEGSFIPLDQRNMQVHPEKRSLQAQIQSDDTVAGVWARKKYEKTANVGCAAGTELPFSNTLIALDHQKNMLQSNISEDSNQKQEFSNMMETQVPCGNDSSKIHGNADQEWHAQTSAMNWNMHTNMYEDQGIWRRGYNQADPACRVESTKSDLSSSKTSRENSHTNVFAAPNSNILNRNQENGRQFGGSQQSPLQGDVFVKTKGVQIVSMSSNEPSSWDQSMNNGMPGLNNNVTQEDSHSQQASDERHVYGLSNPNCLSDLPREIMHLIHGNSSTSSGSSFSFMGNQMQINTSCGPEHDEVMNQHRRPSFGRQPGNEGHSMLTSNLRPQSHDSYAGDLSSQPLSALMCNISGKVLSGNAASSENFVSSTEQCQLLDTGHSQQVNSSPSQLNSGKQVAFFETRSTSQASSTGRGLASEDYALALPPSKQAGMPPMHNVWKNIGPQRLSNAESIEFTSNTVQSMIPLTSGKDSSSLDFQEPYDQRNNARGASSGFGMFPISPQEYMRRVRHHFRGNAFDPMPPEMAGAPRTVGSYQGHESAKQRFSDGNRLSAASLVHPQNLNHGKHFFDSERSCQSPDIPFLKTSSVLASGEIKDFRAPDSGQGTAAHSSTLPADFKILNFSSRVNEDVNPSTSSDIISREFFSENIHTVGHELRSTTSSLAVSTKHAFFGTNVFPHISPQMAPSYVEQYGGHKNGQIFSTYDDLNNFGPALQHHLLEKFRENLNENSILQLRNDMNNVGIIGRSTPVKIRTLDSVSPFHGPSDKMDYHELQKTKKRKTMTSEISWHKVVAQGPQRPTTISLAELDWAHDSNRLIDKVEGDVEMAEDAPTIPRPRRRLILTTHLMQQLIPSVPARILIAESNSSYESVTYVVARSALEDACGMSSCLDYDTSSELRDGIMICDRIAASMNQKSNACAEVVEDFVERSKKQQSDLLRLVGRTASFLDLRLECRDLERFSIINRLGKFHGRSQAELVERSSTSVPASRNMFHERYVTAQQVTGNLPEGGSCLPL